MAEFLPAYQKTMGDEGGWANNPADGGGETYMGISRHYQPTWPGWKTIDAAKVASGPQPPWGTAGYRLYVKVLDRKLKADPALHALVLDFYSTNFWTANLLNQVTNQDVATWLFNHAVNGGGRGIQWMQSAAGVVADGQVGPKTIAAINAADSTRLLEAAMNNAVAYRLQKVAKDPSQKQFLASWLTRDGLPAEKVREICAAHA